MMKYHKIVGTGGIGTGMLFHTDLNETLGRSESRLVTLSDAKDYCKQHIVFSYIAALLKGKAEIYPIGAVGRDSFGGGLRRQMEEQGMDITYVEENEHYPTMISICLQYPDKETCNFTASNSAAGEVTPQLVLDAMEDIGIGPDTIVAAIPEVRLDTRVEMLRYAHAKGAFCALTVPAGEAAEFAETGIYADCDLIAVNEEEARAIAKSDAAGEGLVRAVYEILVRQNEHIMLVATMGKEGAYTVQDQRIEFIPAYRAQAVNTTGAGDAFLGGTLSGLAMGLSLQKGHDDREFGETSLKCAAELGTICAGMAVESEDSIAMHVQIPNILKRMNEKGWKNELWLTK